MLEQLTGRGTHNALLCQPVLAGPEGTTALGNVLVQARAVGELESLGQMRGLVAGATPMNGEVQAW